MRDTMTRTMHWLERPILGSTRWDIEKTLYLLLILLALATRLWGLGWRAMSHDESLHAVYSYKLYNGEGYQHDPMMHGPFLFHANALVYFLFGDNDFTARLVPALFGVVLVALPWFMRRWLGRIGALAASFMLLISPSITYYARYIRNDIYILVYNVIFIILMFAYLERRQARYLYGMAAAMAFMFCTKEVAYIFVLIVGLFLAVVTLIEILQARRFPPDSALFDVTMLVGTLALPMASAFVVKILGFNPLDYSSQGILRSGIVFLVIQGLAAALGLWWRKREWPIAAGVFYAIFTLLYTTFFTNGKGFATGIMGSLGYWLEQQGVQRGAQPWYYYGVVLPIYEFLPLLLGLAAIVVYIVFLPRPDVEAGADAQVVRARGLFMPFAIYWALATIFAYSYAGEKMPWLMVHLALPLIILAGWLVERVFRSADLRKLWSEGGPILALSSILLVFAAAKLLSLRPFQGRDIAHLSETLGWLAALVVGAGLVALVVWYFQRMGARAGLQTLFGALFILLSLFTIRAMWMANYINYDYATEHLVYAHATPDIKIVVGDLEKLSRRLYGDMSIRFSYDDDSTWPLEWYFRKFPNAVYYGDQPNKDVMDLPVVIAGSKNWDKVKPFLGNRYYRFTYKLIWWPLEDYKEWPRQNLLAQLAKPEVRKKLWNAWFYRKFDYDPAEWPLRHEFAVFVRRDIADQVWDFGAKPPEVVKMPADIYLEGMREVYSVAIIGTGPGAGEGQFTNPRNVAVGPDGSIYVLDTDNHRVQVFDAKGQFVRMWGSQGAELGQFQEPWGIAVGKDGMVYVADTWNHRIEKFTSTGEPVKSWGFFGTTDGTLGTPAVFWGPRAIAIDPEGNLYITDTGNKRVQKFSPDGEFLGQWGGFGADPGLFNEPVGIAIDHQGNIYVADTWNRRVQKFDPQFRFLKAWDIYSWEGESVLNKPYLTVGPDDLLYISDPEGYRILVYDLEGKFIASFGTFGADAKSFNLPTGLAADPSGFIYVADAGNHRVMKFPVLPRQ